jgi:peptide/nickel transport system permease protein
LGRVVAFLVRRLGLAVVVLAAFSFLNFWFFSSKDDALKGHPVLPEYWTWLRSFGNHRGLQSGRSLWSLVVFALGHTMALLAGTFVLVVVFSVLVGVAAALWRGSVVDLLLRSVSYVAWGVPAFLLALAVQVVVNAAGSGHGLGPFPLAGWPGSCPAGIGLNHGTISPCPAAGSA